MESMLGMAGMHNTPQKLYIAPSLRQLCINKIAHYAQTDARYTAATISQLPLDTAQPLLDAINDTIYTSHLIARLPGSGQISPDGSMVLVNGGDLADLQLYDAKTGAFLYSLEDSLTSDNKKWTPDNGRFIPINWSSTGRYIYANYRVQKPSIKDSTEYLYKVWDSKTGKKLYHFSFEPCSKLCFRTHDRWLLKQLNGKPLEVCDGATGSVLTRIEDAEANTPQDPQDQWLVINNFKSETVRWYDTQLKLVQTLPGSLKCFSHDGNLFAVSTQEPTGEVHYYFNPLYGERRRIITRPCAHIYNRLFQSLRKISCNGGNSMTISPCQQFLISYDATYEGHFSIDTGLETKKYNHHFDLDTHPLATFSNFSCTGTIALQKRENKTLITIKSDNTKHKFECPGTAQIRYTVYPNIIGLYTGLDTIGYFLNLTTNALIPCNVKTKSLFSYALDKHLAPNGDFVTWSQNGGYELRTLHSVKVTAIIEMLMQKIEAAKRIKGNNPC